MSTTADDQGTIVELLATCRRPSLPAALARKEREADGGKRGG